MLLFTNAQLIVYQYMWFFFLGKLPFFFLIQKL